MNGALIPVRDVGRRATGRQCCCGTAVMTNMHAWTAVRPSLPAAHQDVDCHGATAMDDQRIDVEFLQAVVKGDGKPGKT